jgi:hypothetical protein
MVPSKLVLLATVIAFTVIAGSAGAQATADTNMVEVQKTLEKAGVKDAEKIKHLPQPAIAIFKAAGQGVDAKAIQKAHDEAAQQIPRGGGSNP